MGNPAEQEGAHADVDHGLGYVEAALVVTDEAASTDHPAEGPLHDPAPWEDMEALWVGALDDLDEVEERRLVHQLRAVVARISKEVLEPRPPADGRQDGLRARAVGDVGGGEVTISSRPSVSTATWRLRPTIRLPPS